MHEDEIGAIVVDTAVKLHEAIGCGLYESVYQELLAHELRKRGLHVEREVRIPLEYDGICFDVVFIADMIIDDKVILELKSTDHVNEAHFKQLETYLKITDKRLGYVLNFGMGLMKYGIRRIANDMPDDHYPHKLTVRSE